MVIERSRGRILESVGLFLCVIFLELLVTSVRGVDLLVNIRSGGLKNLRIETCVFLFFSVCIIFLAFCSHAWTWCIFILLSCSSNI